MGMNSNDKLLFIVIMVMIISNSLLIFNQTTFGISDTYEKPAFYPCVDWNTCPENVQCFPNIYHIWITDDVTLEDAKVMCGEVEG